MVIKPENDNIIKRVYHSIKEQVVGYDFPPGERLSIEALAAQLRVSTTPVREILNRLVAEDLIIMVPKMGFFMKTLSESEIRDLYEFNQLMLTWSVNAAQKNWRKSSKPGCSRLSLMINRLSQSEDLAPGSQAKIVGDLFANLASQSGNTEISLRVQSMNDRLYFVRVCECDLIPNSIAELLNLCRLYGKGEHEELIQSVREYHKLRLMSLMELCQMVRSSFPEESRVAEY